MSQKLPLFFDTPEMRSVKGMPVYLTVTRDALVLLDRESGKKLHTYPFKTHQPKLRRWLTPMIFIRQDKKMVARLRTPVTGLASVACVLVLVSLFTEGIVSTVTFLMGLTVFLYQVFQDGKLAKDIARALEKVPKS